MIPWRVEMADQALSDLAVMPSRFVPKVLKSIRLLARDPSKAEIKKLEGAAGSWRLKIGHWRVIFVFNDEDHIIKILGITDRKDAY